MKQLAALLVVMLVMSLAFWAYRENYRTQAALGEMEQVQKDIARLRERLVVLRAEWAYLNRPERLQELVTLNADRLQLAPITQEQFIAPSKIDFPPPPVKHPPRRPEGFVPPGLISEDDPTPAEAAQPAQETR